MTAGPSGVVNISTVEFGVYGVCLSRETDDEAPSISESWQTEQNVIVRIG